jgi:5-methylcytosine-specific restriction endonuclease McrA
VLCFNVDHIKSRKKFPELPLNPKNLQVLCADCNAGKGNRTIHFRPVNPQRLIDATDRIEAELDLVFLARLREHGYLH